MDCQPHEDWFAAHADPNHTWELIEERGKVLDDIRKLKKYFEQLEVPKELEEAVQKQRLNLMNQLDEKKSSIEARIYRGVLRN